MSSMLFYYAITEVISLKAEVTKLICTQATLSRKCRQRFQGPLAVLSPVTPADEFGMPKASVEENKEFDF